MAHNNTKQALDVTIDLQATGLKIPATTLRTATIPAESNVKVSWPVTASLLTDIAAPEGRVVITMTVGATGGTGATGVGATGRSPLRDAVEVTLPVYRYTTPEVVGTSGQVALDEGRLELLRLPADADRSRGGLEVTLAPSLAAGMTGGLTYLEHYPYECVEQTMSRFLPNVVTYQALKKLGISRPDLDATLPQQVGVGLQRIYAAAERG